MGNQGTWDVDCCRVLAAEFFLRRGWEHRIKLLDHREEEDNPMLDPCSRAKAEILVHVDVHFKYVPNTLINFVLKVLAPYLYNTGIKVCALLW